MNYRIFVEKKENFRVEAQNLYNELKENLSIKKQHIVEKHNLRPKQKNQKKKLV